MQGFKQNIEVDVHDVDFNGVCRVSSLMRYIQSTAQMQLTENGMSYDELRDMKRAFIISKIRLEFTSPIRSYDKLEAYSFPCESKGFSFLRCYSLVKDGVAVGRGISVWALINTETKGLVKVRDFNLRLPTYDALDFPIKHFHMPSTLKKVGEYTVCYSDLDQNRHINNTKYPDIFANFIPMDGRRIDAITISYMNDARLGDTLDVYLDMADDVYYIRTVRPDGKTNAEAEVHLCSI